MLYCYLNMYISLNKALFGFKSFHVSFTRFLENALANMPSNTPCSYLHIYMSAHILIAKVQFQTYSLFFKFNNFFTSIKEKKLKR